MRRLYYSFIYYCSAVLFGMVTVSLNLASWPGVLAGESPSRGMRARRVVRAFFEKWTQWLGMTRAVRIDWGDVPKRLPGGVIYVANHPSLVDATVLLSRMEDAVCVVKPSLMQNPIVGPAARLCGYVAGLSLPRLLTQVRRQISGGGSVLIFPEGTRTSVGDVVGPVKPGFAYLAMEAQAPVQVLILEVSEGLGRKGTPWWRVPKVFPATITIRMASRKEVAEMVSSRDLARWVEGELRSGLSVPVSAS